MSSATRPSESASDVDDDDDEYEETYVMVELSGIVDASFFSRAETPSCRIWGLDSQQPILQLDRYFFVGGFDDIVGTALLFDEAEPGEEKDNDEDESSSSEPRRKQRRTNETSPFDASLGPSAGESKIQRDIFTAFTSEAYRKSANLFDVAASRRLDRQDVAASSSAAASSKEKDKKLRLFGHTFKKLSMHRAFLNKKRGDTDLEETAAEETDEVEEVDRG